MDEVQFDCDWSEYTKELYFEFLHVFYICHPEIKLSVTLRLHQLSDYKDINSLEIDKATLMVYNADRVNSEDTKNSVLDIETIKKYINSANKFPKQLNVALPLFSQGVVFRYSNAMYLLNNVNESSLSDPTNFQQIDESHFKAIRNFYFAGNFLIANDIIRLERVTIPDLNQTAALIASKIKSKEIEITFFHLDSNTQKRFNSYEIQAIANHFR